MWKNPNGSQERPEARPPVPAMSSGHHPKYHNPVSKKCLTLDSSILGLSKTNQKIALVLTEDQHRAGCRASGGEIRPHKGRKPGSNPLQLFRQAQPEQSMTS
jgi:hypothetical protein